MDLIWRFSACRSWPVWSQMITPPCLWMPAGSALLLAVLSLIFLFRECLCSHKSGARCQRCQVPKQNRKRQKSVTLWPGSGSLPRGWKKKYGEAAEYGGQGGQRRKKARNKISGKCSTFEAGKRRHDIRGYG